MEEIDQTDIKEEQIDIKEDFVHENKGPLLLCALLFLAAFISYFDSYVGGALLGILSGLFHTHAYLKIMRRIKLLAEEKNHIQLLAIAATGLGLFFMVPYFIIAVAAGIGIMMVWKPSEHTLKG